MEVVVKNVSGVSFVARQGYINCVVGKKPSQVTELFHRIANIDSKYYGTVKIGGTSTKDNPDMVRNIGYISREVKHFDDYTLGLNAKMFGEFYDEFSMDVFLELLKKMDISDNLKPKMLSQGKKMKFQYAFAVAHNSKVLLIDSATDGMDPVFRREFYEMLYKYVEDGDKTVLMTTQISEDITQHVDYVHKI